MTSPLLGVALTIADYPALRDWIAADGRPVEIQDFCALDAIRGVSDMLVEAWRAVRGQLTGPVGLHGPFVGLYISNPDREIRAITQRRLLEGLRIAENLDADQLVIHSPFRNWHHLNRDSYPGLLPALAQASVECLTPVLTRAEETGCRIVIENVDDPLPDLRATLIDLIAHPMLALSLDTGHAQLAHTLYDGPPVTSWIEAGAADLVHFHLQDNDGRADHHWHPLEGCIPWPEVMSALPRCHDARFILEPNAGLDRLPATVAKLAALGLAH